MDSDGVCEINIPRQSTVYLSLVRNKDDKDEGSITGLLNMDSDGVCRINIRRQSTIYLSLVRNKDDKDEGDGEYVKQWFRHTGKKWQLYELRMECEYCDCTEQDDNGLICRCNRTRCCYKLPTRHLFFDLKLPSNEHITMAKRRFSCYKFYTKFVHGVLTNGNTRRVCACVDEEIGNKPPRQEGVNRVGFRS